MSAEHGGRGRRAVLWWQRVLAAGFRQGMAHSMGRRLACPAGGYPCSRVQAAPLLAPHTQCAVSAAADEAVAAGVYRKRGHSTQVRGGDLGWREAPTSRSGARPRGTHQNNQQGTAEKRQQCSRATLAAAKKLLCERTEAMLACLQPIQEAAPTPEQQAEGPIRAHAPNHRPHLSEGVFGAVQLLDLIDADAVVIPAH